MKRLAFALLLAPIVAVSAHAQNVRVQVDTFSAQRAIDTRQADQVWTCQRMALRVAGNTETCLEERYSWDPKTAAAASDRLHIILARLDKVSALLKTESGKGALQDSATAVQRAYQLLDSLRAAGPSVAFSFERALEESVDAYTEQLIGGRPKEVPASRSDSPE